MNLWDEKPTLKYHRGEDRWGNPTRVADYGSYVGELESWLIKLKTQENALRELNHDQFQKIRRLENELGKVRNSCQSPLLKETSE